jgi:hypothetical protein
MAQAQSRPPINDAHPLLQHPRPLPDGQSDPGPVLDGLGEQLACLIKVIASVQRAVRFRAVSRPFLDLVEIALVRLERIVRFFF